MCFIGNVLYLSREHSVNGFMNYIRMRKGVFVIFLVMLAVQVSAYDFKVGDVCYNVTSEMEPFMVEVTYEDYPSVRNYEGVSIVDIPEQVTYNDTVYNVTSIGISAFYNCGSLTSIKIPESVTTLGDSVFYQCTSLQTVNLPGRIMMIPPHTFYHCTSLRSVSVPNSVVIIGESAFLDCMALEDLRLGESVGEIAENAFRKCRSLKEVLLPNSVVSIGKTAFYGCTELSSIHLSAKVEKLGNKLFEGCVNLSEIVVDKNNQTYDSRDGCNAVVLTSENSLIIGCKNTKVPHSVVTIAKNAFSGCSGLESIYIPDGVSSVEEYAFSLCTSLKEVRIGKDVVKIGDKAFSGCSALTSVTCAAVALPQMGYFVFWYVPVADATLYVPAELLEAYKDAEQWKNFGAILPIEQTKIEQGVWERKGARKMWCNGQMLIVSGDKMYNIMGVEL